MNLDEFLRKLQCDPDAIRPNDWEVDWEDAPLTYKLYHGLPAFVLSSEVPLTLEGREAPGKPDLREIGHLLWYVYALTQCSQSLYPPAPGEEQPTLIQSFRRFVPSGGGLYPSELYVYLKLGDLPAGVYHYDAAHHRLVLLREGDFDSYLGRALGRRCELSDCFGAAIVSTVFWKNFFKYHNFAYRLQGLDAGALIGQMLEAANRFGITTAVCYQFLDRAVNHLLGLSEQQESTYAVIPLSVKPVDSWFAHDDDRRDAISAAELCRELPAVRHEQYIRSRTIREYPVLLRMNEACLLESTGSFQLLEGEQPTRGGSEPVALPAAKRSSYDFAAACRKRYSPGMDFVLSKVAQPELAALLHETASFPYRNDLDGARPNPEPRVHLYACLYGVEGLPDGAYRYDSSAHALLPLNPGDHRLRLQLGMPMDNVSLLQVPLCMHVAGDMDYLTAGLGYRGYRIQQMEAGMMTQRLLLAAIAAGFGGHPLLGFDVTTCDDMFNMAPQRKTTLIQIPVGRYRARARLEGALYS